MQSIWALNHALEQLSSRMDRFLGMTAQQRLIVRCVGKRPGIGAGELANLMRVDPGTVSAALNRLESKGLIERSRVSNDLRRVVVRLTPKGEQRNHPRPGTVESAVERLLSEVDETELRAAERVFARLGELLLDEAQTGFAILEPAERSGRG
jgi:DNA-binding MarR family transcriptional regulator